MVEQALPEVNAPDDPGGGGVGPAPVAAVGGRMGRPEPPSRRVRPA